MTFAQLVLYLRIYFMTNFPCVRSIHLGQIPYLVTENYEKNLCYEALSYAL